MLSGVSPCATCQAISPLSISNAVMRPYGGLMSGSPCTVRAPPPPPSAAAAAVAGDGTTAGSGAPPLLAVGAAPRPAGRAAAVAALPETKPKSLFGGAGTRASDEGVVCE